MFIPQVNEADIFTTAGTESDDINSLVEYIDQVVLGHTDAHPEDEDDDSARGCSVQQFTHDLQANRIEIPAPARASNKNDPSTYAFTLLTTAHRDIPTPPPKA